MFYKPNFNKNKHCSTQQLKSYGQSKAVEGFKEGSGPDFSSGVIFVMAVRRAGLEGGEEEGKNWITRRRGSRSTVGETASAGVGCYRACQRRQRTKSRVAWAQLIL